MQTTLMPHAAIFADPNGRLLDELIAPITDLVDDPEDCDIEMMRIVERLSYLMTRGQARQGRAAVLKSICIASMQLFLEEIRHGRTNDDELNWFTLGRAFSVSPRVARQMFSRKN